METYTQTQSALTADLYHPHMAMRLPVQLDARVYDYLATRAQNRGMSMEEMVNDLLKKSIELSWRLAS